MYSYDHHNQYNHRIPVGFSESLDNVMQLTNGISTNSVNGAGGGSGGSEHESLKKSVTLRSVADLDINQTDEFFYHLETGVDQALERHKAWLKYAKELSHYVSRRIAAETNHAQEIRKLGQSFQEALQGENFLPLKALYIRSFNQESEFSDACMEKMRELNANKFLERLEQLRKSQERKRKDLKDAWTKQIKLLVNLELILY